MKRPSYNEAIHWLARNGEDHPHQEFDSIVIQYDITTELMAALFDVDPEKVAKDVVALRRRLHDPFDDTPSPWKNPELGFSLRR
jgi:hypothetical protein